MQIARIAVSGPFSARIAVSGPFSTKIDCDFAAMYGSEFGFLKNEEPDSVFIAEESAVEVEWKRIRLNLE